jgi:acyl-CoA thioester hydrolase
MKKHTFKIRWQDLDANRHVANTSYMSLGIDMRMFLFESIGLTQAYFEEQQIGPVMLRETYFYLKEIMPFSEVTINLQLVGISEDKRFMKLRHEYYSEGELSAVCNFLFVIFSLEKRKMIVAPEQFLEAMEQLDKAEDYGPLTKDEIKKPWINKK